MFFFSSEDCETNLNCCLLSSPLSQQKKKKKKKKNRLFLMGLFYDVTPVHRKKKPSCQPDLVDIKFC